MAKEEQEVEEIVQVADGLLLNIGTAVEQDYKSMIRAGIKANDRGIPVLFDPVGVGASQFRQANVQKLLKEITPTVIKGNAAEIAYLADVKWKAKGVDAVGDGNVIELAEKAFDRYQCPVVLTGKRDVIVTAGKTVTNKTGHRWLERITGAGCLLGTIITSCISVDGDLQEQLKEAVYFYGLAAEYASQLQHVKGPGTFIPHFIDALSYDLTFLKEATK